MTEVELPQLQVGRYVDLLKRRRWQLVPAGLVGLAVGLIVASLIPRYYEAETVVRIYPPPGSTAGVREDPFLEEIGKASNTVKGIEIIRMAVQELGWDVPMDPDDDKAFQQYVWQIRDRISVVRFDDGRPGRSSALLAIRYRDRDGKRAAAMTNKIRAIFLKREKEAVLSRERQHLSTLVTESKKRHQAYMNSLDRRREWLKTYGLNPKSIDPKTGQPMVIVREQEARRIEAEIADLDVKIERNKREVERLKERVNETRQWIEKDPQTDPRLAEILLPLSQEIQRLSEMLRNWTPAYPAYEAVAKRLAAVKEQRKLVLAKMTEQGVTRELNPDWQLAKKLLDETARQLEDDETQRKGRSRRLEPLLDFLGGLPDALTELAKLDQTVEAAQLAFESKDDERKAQADRLAAFVLGERDIIDVVREAWEPPEPTYPNKALVAVLGAAIGLATAIGLIFLFDVMQPTFKSMDDIARELKIPVLGGISHLDLDEEIKAARVRRVKLAAAILVVVGLIGAVLALYLLDPVRLPAWLRDLLDGVFGAAGE